MRLTCPLCGERDIREFSYRGSAVGLSRPDPDAGADAWEDYLHARENVAGVVDELWSHDAGCGAWLKVRRNVVTHEVLDVVLVREGRT